MKWRNFFIVAAVIAPFVLILAFGFGRDPHEVPSVLGGKPAPSCALETLSGEQVDLASYFGKPILLNFWSTWCVPCKTEHGLLQQAANRFGEQITFLGIVYQDTAPKAEAYLSQRGTAYTQLMDIESKCAINYGVAGVPETFFIRPDGTIQYKQVGPVYPQLLAEKFQEIARGAPQ